MPTTLLTPRLLLGQESLDADDSRGIGVVLLAIVLVLLTLLCVNLVGRARDRVRDGRGPR